MAERQSSNLHQQIIGNCVGCQGLIRLSTQTNVNSKIRCPHCKEVFPVVSILDQAAPMAEVVDDAGEESVVAHVDRVLQSPDKQRVSADSFVVPPQLAKGARRRRRSSSSSSRRRSSSRGESRESSREAQPEASRQTASEPETNSRVDVMDRGDAEIQVGSDAHDQERRSKAEPRRRSGGEGRSRQSRGAVKAQQDFERNPGYEFLKVGFGAALALPIAYLLVIWVFGQDPLGVGKSIGGTAPFLVPAEYRAGAADAKDEKVNEKKNREVIDIDPRMPGNDLIPYLAPKTLDDIGR